MKMRFIVAGIFVVIFIIVFFASQPPPCAPGGFEKIQSVNKTIANGSEGLYVLQNQLNSSESIQKSTLNDVEYKEIKRDIYAWVIKNEVAIDKEGNIYVRLPCL